MAPSQPRNVPVASRPVAPDGAFDRPLPVGRGSDPGADGGAGPLEFLDTGGDRQEDILHDIVGIGAGHLPAGAPLTNQRGIKVHQALPGLLVVRLDPVQQAQGSQVSALVALGHRLLLWLV